MQAGSPLSEKEITMEDELMGMVLQLAGWVEGVAPEVWAIMMRQTLLKGKKNIFGVVVTLIITICLALACRVFYKQSRDGKHEYSMVPEMGMTFSGIGVVVGIITFCGMFTEALGYLLTPQYYALQGIITLFK